MKAAVDVEIALDLRLDLGEGPVWDDTTRTLIFVESNSGTIHRFDPKLDVLNTTKIDTQVGVAIPRQSGGLVVTATDGLLAVDDGGVPTLLAPIERHLPMQRMNDAKCDSLGRMISGTFSLKLERGAGALYRIDPDLKVECLLSDVSVSNGIGWSPDEGTLYFVDTSTRGVDAFDYAADTGAMSNRRRFIDVDRTLGFPDGLTVDAEGHVWLALYRGGALRRYAPDGRLVAIVELPVSGVTSCTFGGAELEDLYITTARYGIPPEVLEREPSAGSLFRCRPGVVGLPSHRFAG